MENKINIAELLKDCPKGMELDCTMFDNATLDYIDYNSCYPIRIRMREGAEVYLTQYGQLNHYDYAKCVIFPKGKTTWGGFVPPCRFKDGDIVFYNDTISIFKEWGDETLFRTYVSKYLCCDSLIYNNAPLFGKNVRKEIRFATEEEKQKLFDAIKANGFKWNAETKTLEKLIKPKFKVGDRIVKKNGITVPILITGVSDEYYYSNTKSSVGILSISAQDEYELVPDKFNTTLKPFDKVLVRDSGKKYWSINFFGFYNEITEQFHCMGNTEIGWNECIPYEGNERLLGTTNDCDEYYKTW